MNAQNPFFAAEASQWGPGHYHGIPDDEYHRAPGISKSGLDLVAHNPATYIWQQNAPVDPEKTGAFDLGKALHCRLLEPNEFQDRFIIAPYFNRRTNDGKAEEAAFLAEREESGKIVMDAEDGRKLDIMFESAMAHPVVRWLFEQAGTNESTIVWIDPETGETCRCRPDRMLTQRPILVDVKKVDGLDRFERHVEEFRYHVQDAMYSEGYFHQFGTWPQFLFLIVSSTVSGARYPVDVVELPEDWKQAGRELFRRDLNTYHACQTSNDWMQIRQLKRPRWAQSQDQE